MDDNTLLIPKNCYIDVIKIKQRLNKWEGTLSISEVHQNEAEALALLDGELELDLGNYKGKIIINHQGSGEIRFTGEGKLIEKE